MITRHSSRLTPLDRHFLNDRLAGALAYDRIAGFFSSSILEVAGEALEGMAGPVRMVCNSVVDPRDVQTAQRAATAALRREWCASEPVLILAPKPLIWQWQREMASLLDMLLRFPWDIAPRTRSLLLATATPVQLHPIEAWDLLDALARGCDAVLGGIGSPWRKPRQAIELLLGEAEPPADELGQWAWMRNPLPPAAEGPDYTALRRALRLPDTECCADGGSFQRLSAPDRARLRRVFPRFHEHGNPFIRHNESCWSAS